MAGAGLRSPRPTVTSACAAPAAITAAAARHLRRRWGKGRPAGGGRAGHYAREAWDCVIQAVATGCCLAAGRRQAYAQSRAARNWEEGPQRLAESGRGSPISFTGFTRYLAPAARPSTSALRGWLGPLESDGQHWGSLGATVWSMGRTPPPPFSPLRFGTQGEGSAARRAAGAPWALLQIAERRQRYCP